MSFFAANFLRFCIRPLAVCCITISLVGQTGSAVQQKTSYQQDFDYYWQVVCDDFAYFDGHERKRSDWEKVRAFYTDKAANVTTRAELVRLLESANNELFNGHITLNVNLSSSNRIIPSGADLWAEPDKDHFVIADVREGFNAAQSGLKSGMVLKTFNGEPIDVAAKRFLPLSVSSYSPTMYEYALNMLLSGSHNTPRMIGVLVNGNLVLFRPDESPNRTDTPYSTLLSSRILPSGVGYIKIHNSLGNTDLIKSFDQALDAMLKTRGLILDLRETPSGGNTTVARGILGRFVTKELPYQKIAYPDELRLYGVERTELDLVSPRAKQYINPVVVLVGRWTGSVGEGLTIGFDSTQRAEIVGTKMAGLLGAVCSYQLPVSKIGFSIPCQQTLQVNGKPREDFVPSRSVPPGRDAIFFAEESLLSCGGWNSSSQQLGLEPIFEFLLRSHLRKRLADQHF
jgi:hypothetical protein